MKTFKLISKDKLFEKLKLFLAKAKICYTFFYSVSLTKLKNGLIFSHMCFKESCWFNLALLYPSNIEHSIWFLQPYNHTMWNGIFQLSVAYLGPLATYPYLPLRRIDPLHPRSYPQGGVQICYIKYENKSTLPQIANF